MCYNMGCPHEGLSGKCSGIPRGGCPMESEDTNLSWFIEPAQLCDAAQDTRARAK